MRKLPLIILVLTAFILLSAFLLRESPHGKDFKVPCDKCHSAKGWKLDKEIYSFDHNTTAMPLTGQHQSVDCRACHVSLVFSEAKTECVDCHTDMHQQTVGPDCGRCHTPKSWIVDDITSLHQRSRFPLLGAHMTASCGQCHPSSSLLRFDPRGVECVDCHRQDYNSTTNPNHAQSGYSTNCVECHSMTAFSWSGNINHSFFPLEQGHNISDCYKCHTQGTYSGLSSECVSCHLDNYNATDNPNHAALGFPTTCNTCHTLAPGWKPASYAEHDQQFFPIYSGSHNGKWNLCSDCHPNPSNYGQYTCTNCHQKAPTDSEHTDVGGYSWSDQACLSCHPRGSSEGSFNHNSSIFPLTGAHITTPCNQCHVTQYAGTPTACPDCHMTNYNATTNPNHKDAGIQTECSTCHTTDPGWKPALFPDHNNYYSLTGAHATTDCNSCHNNNYSNTPNTCVGCHLANYNGTTNPDHSAISIPTTCADCHTTNPGWKPATFAQHNNYYPLTGAHATVDCNSCHNGNYTNTPNTCAGCHMTDYNQTNNPPHASEQFPTNCESCHNNIAWIPSTFNHDAQYFPIYSGKHNGRWNTCSDCHTNPGNYSVFTCITCHTQAETNSQHDGVSGYAYNSNACLNCHPDGSAPRMQRPSFDRKKN